MKTSALQGTTKKLVHMFVLILISLAITFTFFTIDKAKADDITWTQTDWSGGSSLSVVNDQVNTFLESTNIEYSNEGYVEVGKKNDWSVDLLDWNFRSKVNFNNTDLNLQTTAEVLTDFPVAIKLEDGVNIDYSQTNDDGSDLRFVDTDGTLLSYEIEVWDESRDSVVWVKVPQIDIGEEDYIWIYYGNESATDAQSINDVWSNGFAAVYHMNQIGSGQVGEFLDSTSNLNNATGGQGNVNYIPSRNDGVIGYGQSLDGNDFLYVGNQQTLRITGDMTINMWLYPRNPNSRQNPYAKAYGGEGTITQEPNGTYNYYYGTSGVNGGSYQGVGSSATYATGQWNYVSLIRDLTNRKIYWHINNVRTLTTNANYASAVAGNEPVYIGKGYTAPYNGDIDEVWISNVARTYGWNNASYKSMLNEFQIYGEAENIYNENGTLISNIYDVGYSADWGTISYSPNSQDVNVYVRSGNESDMGNAADWNSCGSLDIGNNVKSGGCVNDEDRYIQYKVVINLNTNISSPQLEDISITFSASDQIAPVSNASNAMMEGAIVNGDWIHTLPTISWDPGSDDSSGNGLQGYCISLDEVNIGDLSHLVNPSLSAGVLSSLDDGITNDACPYIVSGNYINLEEIEGLELTSNKKYYFSIKAVDLAGNIWIGDGGEYQDLVYFKYDNVIPSNVMYISTPSTNFGSVDDMFFNWPISGAAQATDSHSGIIGWQYALNSTEPEDWKGSITHPTFGFEYIPLSSGLNIISLSNEENGEDIIVGNNTIYFRSIDTAGNVSSYVTGGINYGGAAPAFPAESRVTITPTISTQNEYALSWPEATPGDGRVVTSYYYMINVQPPSSLSTLRANSNIYIPITTRSVPLGMLTGAVKGSNSVYVVAVDDGDNYSPTKAISGTFELNSTLPDAPRNVAVADLSLKGSELWRVAITWDIPEYRGNGNLKYIVERSLDSITWDEISQTTGLSYTDITPESREYFYRVATYDTSNESRLSPTYSIPVSTTPKGRYDEPAELVSPAVVTNITTRNAQINWVTDRTSDSKVQIGVESGSYFEDEMYRSDMVTNHEIYLKNLQPGTMYYYRIKWTDEDGNTGVSKESLIQTKPAPIVEDVVIDKVGLNYAILKLTTSGATKAQVIYGKTKTYGATQEINTSTSSSEYSIMLNDLEDGSEYHYKIVLTDEEGYQYESFEDHMFVTPPRPQVSNVQIQEMREVASPTVEVFWESNIEVNSIVTYYPVKEPSRVLDKVVMEMVKGEHKMEISGLQPDSGYQLVVEGVDVMGNKAVSDIYTFTTATDTRPPKIFNIRSEGDVQSRDVQSDRARSGQLVISWETDEPSTSQVFYGEGASGDGYPYSTQTDAELRSKHVVVISNLAPSKVYHFKVVSKDIANNSGESGSVTAITPKSSDTVVESVLGSLSRIFGFLQ